MPPKMAPSKKAKKSGAPKANRNTVPAAVLAEVNDVKQEWYGRQEAIIAKHNDWKPLHVGTFNMTIKKLGAMADLKMCWDSEVEDEDNVENVPLIAAPLDSTVSTSVVSRDFVSVTSSFVTHSEESRSRVITAKTRAQRSSSVGNSTTSYKTAQQTLRSSSHGRDRLAEMSVPSTVRSGFCTPATHMVADGSRYYAIVPKVVPNSILPIIRIPSDGEMVFSQSGSLLMIPPTNKITNKITYKITNKIWNISVPLKDGTTFTIPAEGPLPRDMPHFDDAMEQLTQLRNCLDAIFNNHNVQ